jgi:aarF domain-containing kinase
VQRGGSILDLAAQTPEEAHFIREAVIGEGLIQGIFELLRRIPRRLLMVIKLKCVSGLLLISPNRNMLMWTNRNSDLTRSLDHSLHPTHPPYRVWLVVAQFCVRACWIDDSSSLRSRLSSEGFSLSLTRDAMGKWWSSFRWGMSLTAAEWAADTLARWEGWRLWAQGLVNGGVAEARVRWAGLKGKAAAT